MRHARPCAAWLSEATSWRAARELVKSKSGELTDARLVPGVDHLLAQGCCPSVLPDDGPARGAERLAIPDRQGLALVGDAYRDDARLVPRNGLLACSEDGGPDVAQIVLDPAIGGEVLGELSIAARDHMRRAVHEQCGDAGGSRVDREDECVVPIGVRGSVRHGASLSRAVPACGR